MRWAIKHYAQLDHQMAGNGRSLLRAQSWDALRVEGPHDEQYSIPPDRSAWIERCAQDQAIVERAAAIVDLIRILDVRRVFSAGVGRACLEYHIKRIDPHVHMACSDYAPRSVEAVRHNFVECDSVCQFDIRTDYWPKDVDLYLLHRIDTELDDAEWHAAFEAIRRGGARYVLFVPAHTLSVAIWLRETAKRLLYLARDPRFTFAGYLRTVDSINALWSETHSVKQHLPLAGLRGFLLERIP